MTDQSEDRTQDVDGWPLPSRDVLRDLERPALAWPEPRGDGESWSTARAAAAA